jgi:pimeloyl-ACP methyl ester carboxylesterase
MTQWTLPETYLFEGRRVCYGVRGEGPSVVIVHGTPWSSFNLRGMIPGARWHVIPEAGHLVIEEKPDLLVQAIRPFLKEHARH